MRLYKYFPLSDKKQLKYITDCLNQNIWFTAFKKFNDPFEGMFINKNRHPRDILADETLFNFAYEAMRNDFRMNPNEFRAMLSDPVFQEGVDDTNKTHELFKDWGAACFTTSYNNILMWSYYASNHQGCCIEFELDFNEIESTFQVSKEGFSDYRSQILNGSEILSFHSKYSHDHIFIFLRVLYENDMPVIDNKELLAITDPYSKQKYAARNSMGQKFKNWAHEDEFRLITNTSSEQSGLLSLPGYAPFLKATGIIIGSGMEEDHEAIIRGLCDQLNISVYKARCSKDNYKIIVAGYDPTTG